MSRFVRPAVVAFAALAVVSAAALVASGRSPSAAAVVSQARPTWFADIAPIIQGRCLSCHRVGGVASSLRTYAQVFAQRRDVARTVRTRTMPPWQAARGHRAYRADPSLTQAQITAITRWVAQGAKKGSAGQKGRPLRRLGTAQMRADSTVRVPAFTPRFTARDRDDQRCFVLSWAPRTLTYISGFRALPGPAGEVRRVNVYAIPGQIAADLERWDATDPRPGYNCFGGPSPLGEPASLLVATLASVWNAGYGGTQLMPTGSGMPILPGTKLVAEVHYGLERGPARADGVSLQFQLEPGAARLGFVVSLFDARWASPGNFRIPSGARGTSFTARIDTALLFQIFEANSVRVDMAYVHMQHLGSRALVRVERAGSPQVLLSVPRWDITRQPFYWFARPLTLRPGDAISVECRYDNSAANQPLVNGVRQQPRDVVWGTGPTDEMCIGAAYISGKLRTSAASASRSLRQAAGGNRSAVLLPSSLSARP